MTNTLTLSQIREVKKNAEDQILKIIMDFSEKAGVPPNEIAFNYISTQTACGYKVGFKIELKVEV